MINIVNKEGKLLSDIWIESMFDVFGKNELYNNNKFRFIYTKINGKNLYNVVDISNWKIMFDYWFEQLKLCGPKNFYESNYTIGIITYANKPYEKTSNIFYISTNKFELLLDDLATEIDYSYDEYKVFNIKDCDKKISYKKLNDDGTLVDITDKKFDEGSIFYKGRALVRIKDKGYNYIDANGEYIWKHDTWFTSVSPIESNGYVNVYYKRNLYELYLKDGCLYNRINGTKLQNEEL